MENKIIGSKEVKVSDLKVNQKNWRVHTEIQARVLAESIDKLGVIKRIIVLPDMTIIDGEARYNHAMSQGPETMVPVDIVDLTPDQADLALAALDTIAGMPETGKKEYFDLLKSINVSFGDDINKMLSDMSIDGLRIDVQPLLESNFLEGMLQALEDQAAARVDIEAEEVEFELSPTVDLVKFEVAMYPADKEYIFSILKPMMKTETLRNSLLEVFRYYGNKD